MQGLGCGEHCGATCGVVDNGVLMFQNCCCWSTTVKVGQEGQQQATIMKGQDLKAQHQQQHPYCVIL